MPREELGTVRASLAQRNQTLPRHRFDRVRNRRVVETVRMERIERLIRAERARQAVAVEASTAEIAVQEDSGGRMPPLVKATAIDPDARAAVRRACASRSIVGSLKSDASGTPLPQAFSTRPSSAPRAANDRRYRRSCRARRRSRAQADPPDRCDRELQRIPRRDVNPLALFDEVHGVGQRAAIDLAVRSERKCTEHDDAGGDHVFGQRAAQVAPQIGRNGLGILHRDHIRG